MFHFTFNKKEFMRQSTNSILMIRSSQNQQISRIYQISKKTQKVDI